MDEAVAKTIGNRADQMWYIDSLSTEPASQGQGFGGALLDSVTTLVRMTFN
jgi:ribosomal protein S18 acetylase RimI-like enzyme